MRRAAGTCTYVVFEYVLVLMKLYGFSEGSPPKLYGFSEAEKMKLYGFSVDNHPESPATVENGPAGSSPPPPRSSRRQGRSPAKREQSLAERLDYGE